VGKKNVGIESVAPVGNYALQLNFTDGHNTGLYSWDLLYDLGLRQETLWNDYLARLEAASQSRDPS
jgi:DUF971 family protein